MATKRKEYDGADSFIERMRKNAVPTYHTAADSPVTETSVRIIEPAPPSEQSEPNDLTRDISPQRETVQADNKSDENLTMSLPDFSFDDSFEGLNMTELERNYVNTFITQGRFRRVNSGGRQVVIREKYREIIQTVCSLLSKECNMAIYIDNVLTEHFKKYYPTIVGIYRKCPSKL